MDQANQRILEERPRRGGEHASGSRAAPRLPGVTLTLTAGHVLSVAATGCLNTASRPCTDGGAFALAVLDDQ